MNKRHALMQVYLNGEFIPHDRASLSIDDRGTLFADGVYEVLEYHGGRPFAIQQHLDRLRYSLAGIELTPPTEVDRLPMISDELVRRNGLSEARVYWQVTRGPAPRNHLPPADPTPSVLVTATPAPPFSEGQTVRAWKAVSCDDLRWKRCCYKTLMLLPNALAKQQAHGQGCQEAILHAGGVVTEGSSTNVFVVRDGALWTHPANAAILGGITREIVIECAKALNIPVRETAVRVDELRQAQEVFLTGTTTHVAGVTHLDGQPIGTGEIGRITTRLHEAYGQRLMESCGAIRSTGP